MKPTDLRVPLLSRLRNWLSMAGLVTMGASFFANLLLFLVDSFGRSSNPYVGVLTYLVAPALRCSAW
ncbi:MAG: hypothetical protein IPM17_12735 [Verrucomicrobia bacterium]|nr:hypothetical protein [Verrucomicrobiota bacterium]